VLPEDLIGTLSGAAGSPALTGLRASRDGVQRSAQQAADALFRPRDSRGLQESTRLQIAGFVSTLAALHTAAAHYFDWADRAGADPAVTALVRETGLQAARSGPYGVHIEAQLHHEAEPGPDLSLPAAAAAALGPRLSAALSYAHTVVLHPRDGRPDRVQALLDGGFSPAQVSILTQLICLVSFQMRVVAGLGGLAGRTDA
jgi:CMD domain protein